MVKKAHFDHSHAWAPLKVPKHEMGQSELFKPFEDMMFLLAIGGI